MGRRPCCDKAKVKRGCWSPEEDAILKNYLLKHGTAANWITLPQKAGLQRCGKSCRLRWLNYLRPGIKRGPFTKEEDNIICNLYCQIGSRWSVVAAKLPGRTDNDVKNYWNTKLKKKLMLSNCSDSSSPPVHVDNSAAAAFQEASIGSAFPVPLLQPDQYNGLDFAFPGYNILEGSASNNGSSRANDSCQDSNPFGSFSLGMHDMKRMEVEEQHTCTQVVGGIWSQEQVFGAADSDDPADLFSNFPC